MHRQLARQMRRRLGPHGKVGQHRTDRRHPVGIILRIGHAQHRLGPRLRPAADEDAPPAGMHDQPGQQFRKLAHIVLRISGPDAQSVQLQQLARQVLVQPAPPLQPDLGIRPERDRLVEVDQHGRMCLDRQQQVREPPRQVGPDRIADQRGGQFPLARAPETDGEMVGPEQHQPFAEPLGRGDHPAQCRARLVQNRPGDRLPRRAIGRLDLGRRLTARSPPRPPARLRGIVEQPKPVHRRRRQVRRVW